MDNAEQGEHTNAPVDESLEITQKERHWEQLTNDLREHTDKLGRPIEEGILETVVGLNLLGIRTSQSCEGHLERGSHAPWIEIQAEETDELKKSEERLRELSDRIETLEMKGAPDDEIDNLYKQYRVLHAEVMRPQLQELQKAMFLLTEFYKDRPVAYDQLLTIDGFRITNQGAQFQEIASAEERKQHLLAYREEMNAFTAFLKNKYFGFSIQ